MRLRRLTQAVAVCAIGLAPAYGFNYGFLSETVLANLTPEDVKIGTEATGRALNDNADGEWSNPKTGASGKIKLLRTLDVDGHKDCREVRLEVNAGGKSGHGKYVLCQRPSGKWAFYSGSK